MLLVTAPATSMGLTGGAMAPLVPKLFRASDKSDDAGTENLPSKAAEGSNENQDNPEVSAPQTDKDEPKEELSDVERRHLRDSIRDRMTGQMLTLALNPPSHADVRDRQYARIKDSLKEVIHLDRDHLESLLKRYKLKPTEWPNATERTEALALLTESEQMYDEFLQSKGLPPESPYAVNPERNVFYYQDQLVEYVKRQTIDYYNVVKSNVKVSFADLPVSKRSLDDLETSVDQLEDQFIGHVYDEDPPLSPTVLETFNAMNHATFQLKQRAYMDSLKGGKNTPEFKTAKNEFIGFLKEFVNDEDYPLYLGEN